MAKKGNNAGNSLIDWVRATDVDGPLVGVVLSTYGLSMDQPDFFGQDFLPTMLGLGGIKNRGYASPLTLDRVLSTADVILIVDSHAVAEGMRPTLRVDVLPIGHKLQHAKVFLLHRRDRVRLIVASANLTHEGFRRQREIAIVMDFWEGGSLPGAILTRAVSNWLSVLKDSAHSQLRQILNRAAARAEALTAGTKFGAGPEPEVIFGGGDTPLWQQFVDRWPTGERVLQWRICSPFWPKSEDGSGGTPFEACANGLEARGASLEECEIEIIARADGTGKHALPRFPFSLIRHLREKGFPVRSGRIMPARLEAVDDEVPSGMAAESRDLHAKWVVLVGPQTVLALAGSANFTRQGMGSLTNQAYANFEACVLLRLPRNKWDEEAWRPPIHGQIVDWATCSAEDLCAAPMEEEAAIDWPQFISRIELLIHWEQLPDPTGRLRIHYRVEFAAPYRVEFPHTSSLAHPPQTISGGSPSTVREVALDAEQARSVLARRTVRIVWDGERRSCSFPINVMQDSKAGIPSVLGAKPTEEQLLAYFHGRISEEDLLARLEQEAKDGIGLAPSLSAVDIERLRQLQSYVVREFVESLFGLEQTIRDSSFSPRALEIALLGDLSPVSLAEQVAHAFLTGRRSATAAAFQLAELIRVVGETTWSVPHDKEALTAMETVRSRSLQRLFALVTQLARRDAFATVLQDAKFSGFVRAALPGPLAKQWRSLTSKSSQDQPAEAPANQEVETSEGVVL